MQRVTKAKDLMALVDDAIKKGLVSRKDAGIVLESPHGSIKAKLYHKALEEKEKQDSLFGGDDKNDDSSNEVKTDKNDSSKDSDKDDEKMAEGKISVEDIIEKLNTIRSGRSFKDDEIKGKLSSYIEKLDTAERTALLAFLKGVAQITTGEVDSEDAEQPDAPAPNVHMKKDVNRQAKHVDPNVIKGAPKNVDKPKKDLEDDSGPTPIVPKKK